MAGHWLQSGGARAGSWTPKTPHFSASPLPTEQIKDEMLLWGLGKPPSTWAGTPGGRGARSPAWRCWWCPNPPGSYSSRCPRSASGAAPPSCWRLGCPASWPRATRSVTSTGPRRHPTGRTAGSCGTRPGGCGSARGTRTRDTHTCGHAHATPRGCTASADGSFPPKFHSSGAGPSPAPWVGTEPVTPNNIWPQSRSCWGGSSGTIPPHH